MAERPQREPAVEMLMRMFQGLQVSGLLSAGIELGVFGALDGRPCDAAQLAARIRCPPRSTRILADVLAALGLLTKSGASYSLSAPAEMYLVPDKPGYLGALPLMFTNPTMWSGYQRFAEAVRNDGTVLTNDSDTPDNDFYRASARATGMAAMESSGVLGEHLAPWIESRKSVRVLDVAAGSGIYGYVLARHSNVQLTVLDWPAVLVEAKEWAKQLGVDSSRVRYLEGSLFELNFEGPYDVIVMSHIYHQFDEETCVRLTRKVADSLASGGRLVIHDFFYDESLQNPAGAFFSATGLALTKKGEAFSEAQYRRWIGDVGLKGVAVFAAGGTPSSFLVCEK